MASVNQREWRIPGQRTKRLAWGFSVTVNGKRTKQYRSEWSKEDAEKELATVMLRLKQQPAVPVVSGITLAQAAERYLAAKARKRDLVGDMGHLERLKLHFGADTPLSAITAAAVSEYKSQRLSVKSQRTGKLLTAAAVNRPLALLRHLLRLAHEEWELLPSVPKIRLEKEPEGRIRWLEPEEQARLLAACEKSNTKHLLALVTVAMETGLRKGELLNLTWSQVDMSRGMIRLEMTKSGKRREVPMRQVVYNVLSQLPGSHEGRVWPAGGVRTSFENAVAAANLDAPLHFHDLRHHFASWYVMRGGSLPSLQKILGHSTLTMTMRYAHLSSDHLRDEMARTEFSPNRAHARAHEAIAEGMLLAK